MGKLWQRTPGADGKSQLNELDIHALKIAQPTLVYLSGFLTNNNRPDYVAGSIKRMEEMLANNPSLPAQPPIYAWSHTDLRNLFNLAAYNMRPSKRSSQAGYDLGSSLLMPLVTKDFGLKDSRTATGSPLPLDEAKKNVKNITFFGYSAGTIVAQETFNATLKMMKGVGYSEKDAREVLNEVVLVSVGNISRPSKETDRFTTVYIAATNDRITRAKNWVWGTAGTLLRTIFGNYAKKQKELTIRPLSKTSIFVTAPVRPSLYEWKYDENGERIKKKFFDPLYPSWTLRRSYHELPHYITTDENNNSLAQISLHAVVNALTRAGGPKALRLIEPSSGTKAENAEYRLKIANALRPAPKALAQGMKVS